MPAGSPSLSSLLQTAAASNERVTSLARHGGSASSPEQPTASQGMPAMQLRRAPPCHCRRCTALLSRSRMQRSLQCSLSPVQQGEATRLLLPPFRLSHGVPPRQRSPLLYCHARSLLGPGARTSTKMQLSGLVFLLLGSAACFDIDIAPPKLGLRRLFRRPYRGPICVIEIIGAELNPRANRGTACPINRAPSHVLSLASGCATRRACEPLTQHVLAADSLQHAQVASTGAVPSACSPRACRTSGWSGRTGRSLARPRSGIVVSSKLDSDPSLNPHPDPNHNPDPKPTGSLRLRVHRQLPRCGLPRP